ncbi:hypothetical protein Y032_0110g145 [Ancylostoma ceylanicum]|uniref:Uncharacterized protein n=1 Tax=Ancylostoma ceylanicum TaxID=53326 RepID=A0A016TDT2_9BILA|nr:hypothetical protein Y032_0110g145 [Ancylostoma ceylanicum]
MSRLLSLADDLLLGSFRESEKFTTPRLASHGWLHVELPIHSLMSSTFSVVKLQERNDEEAWISRAA